MATDPKKRHDPLIAGLQIGPVRGYQIYSGTLGCVIRADGTKQGVERGNYLLTTQRAVLGATIDDADRDAAVAQPTSDSPAAVCGQYVAGARSQEVNAGRNRVRAGATYDCALISIQGRAASLSNDIPNHPFRTGTRELRGVRAATDDLRGARVYKYGAESRHTEGEIVSVKAEVTETVGDDVWVVGTSSILVKSKEPFMKPDDRGAALVLYDGDFEDYVIGLLIAPLSNAPNFAVAHDIETQLSLFTTRMGLSTWG